MVPYVFYCISGQVKGDPHVHRRRLTRGNPGHRSHHLRAA